MIHLTIHAPTEDHELDVHSTDIVGPFLEKYAANFDNPEHSRYCELAFIIGEDIPLDTSKTFAECDIQSGDTLYPLLRMEENILVKIDLGIRDVTIPMPLSRCGTVGNVIETLCSIAGKYIGKAHATALDLRLGDEILDRSKTLAEYETIKNKQVIRLALKERVKVSIGVLRYTKMEQVLFENGDTVADVKKKVETMIPGFTERIREAYPVPLKGMVNICEKGTTCCMYLDLFLHEMKMFVCEYTNNGEQMIGKIGSHISGESTLTDVQKIMKMDARKGVIYRPNWPKHNTYDCAWMRSFAPQIQAKPYSDDTSIALFFFPLRVETIQSDDVRLYTSTGSFVSIFCRQNTVHLPGTKRSLYHPREDVFLTPNECLGQYYHLFASDGESSSVILTKQRRHNESRSWRGTKMQITVQVRWQNRIQSFLLNSRNTINTLRDKIEDMLQVPFYMQKLMFNGKPVQCDSTFATAGIIDHSKLDLLASQDFQRSDFSPR